MITLTQEPVSSLLARLFEEAKSATIGAVADFSSEERERLMRSKTDYLQLYGLLKDAPLPVSP